MLVCVVDGVCVAIRVSVAVAVGVAVLVALGFGVGVDVGISVGGAVAVDVAGILGVDPGGGVCGGMGVSQLLPLRPKTNCTSLISMSPSVCDGSRSKYGP